jgi:lipopolysaccharide biosynthesis glycosyltransferase
MNDSDSASTAPVRPETARIFVGTDRSQLLAVKVLEYSLRKHASIALELRPMLDLPLPEPKDPRQGKRTGFSFARFAIPELAGYEGRALYLDADMLVFADVAPLWRMPFAGAKVIIQDDIPAHARHPSRTGAPTRRIRQSAVMLLDCDALDWDPRVIIAGLDGRYTYEELVYQLCVLKPDEIRCTIPFEWNSLEHYEEGKTCLIHYTDMSTQPWVSPENRNGFLWVRCVREMLDAGALSMDEIEQDIALGYVRPSLKTEIKAADGSGRVTPSQIQSFVADDRASGYVKHREVYEAKRRREASIRPFHAGGAEAGGVRLLRRTASHVWSALRRIAGG